MNDASKPTGRQAKRKEKTRALLVEATTALLLEKGVEALTVGDITERADVARGTFYVYFESKEDAVWSLLESFLTDIESYLAAQKTTQDAARFAKWRYIFGRIAKDKDVLVAILGNKGHITALRRMEAFTAQLMMRDLEAGQLIPKDNVPIAFIAQYLAGALTKVMVNWLENPESMSLDDLSSYFFTLTRQQFEAD